MEILKGIKIEQHEKITVTNDIEDEIQEVKINKMCKRRCVNVERKIFQIKLHMYYQNVAYAYCST